MVKDPGAAVRPHRLRPLASPQRLDVMVDSIALPRTLHFEGAMRDVSCVQDRWRIDDEWWRERSVARLYYQLQLDGGRVITVFRDLNEDSWWLQRY